MKLPMLDEEKLIQELLDSQEDFGLDSKQLEEPERALDQFEKPSKVGG